MLTCFSALALHELISLSLLLIFICLLVCTWLTAQHYFHAICLLSPNAPCISTHFLNKRCLSSFASCWSQTLQPIIQKWICISHSCWEIFKYFRFIFTLRFNTCFRYLLLSYLQCCDHGGWVMSRREYSRYFQGVWQLTQQHIW